MCKFLIFITLIVTSFGSFSAIKSVDVVYRFDIRPPEVIFEQGFTINGENDSLYHHVAENYPFRETISERSAYIATTSDYDFAFEYLENSMQRSINLIEHGYIYEINTNENFFDVNGNLEFALANYGFDIRRRNLIRRVLGTEFDYDSDYNYPSDSSDGDFYTGFANESEFVSNRNIAASSIVSVRSFRRVVDGMDVNAEEIGQENNSRYDPETSDVGSNPDPLPETVIFGEWFQDREDRNTIASLLNSMVDQVASDLLECSPATGSSTSSRQKRETVCHEAHKIVLTNDYQTGKLCLHTNQDLSNSTGETDAQINYCSRVKGKQSDWLYTSHGQLLQTMNDSKSHKNYYCLTNKGYADRLSMEICNTKDIRQSWAIKSVKSSGQKYSVMSNGDYTLANNYNMVYKVDNSSVLFRNMTDPLYQFELEIKPYFYSDGSDGSLFEYDGDSDEYLKPYSDWASLRKDFYRKTYYNAHATSLFSIREPQYGESYASCFESEMTDSWEWVRSTACSPLFVTDSQKWFLDFSPIKKYLSYGQYYYIDRLRIESAHGAALFIDYSGAHKGYAFSDFPPYSAGMHVNSYVNFYSKQSLPINPSAVENRWESRPKRYDVLN